MSFNQAGLENANEFYSQHYLDEVVERDLKPLFDRWKEQGAESPASRVKSAGGAAYFRARERFLAEKKLPERRGLLRELAKPILSALGYDGEKAHNLELADGELPVLAVYRDAKGAPLLVIAEAVASPGEEDSAGQAQLGGNAHQVPVRRRRATALGASRAP
jgi:hypothetical protein